MEPGHYQENLRRLGYLGWNESRFVRLRIALLTFGTLSIAACAHDPADNSGHSHHHHHGNHAHRQQGIFDQSETANTTPAPF